MRIKASDNPPGLQNGDMWKNGEKFFIFADEKVHDVTEATNDAYHRDNERLALRWSEIEKENSEEDRYTESEREAIGYIWDDIGYLYYGSFYNFGWERAIIKIYYIIKSAERRRKSEAKTDE